MVLTELRVKRDMSLDSSFEMLLLSLLRRRRQRRCCCWCWLAATLMLMLEVEVKIWLLWWEDGKRPPNSGTDSRCY